jgi:hypothetical protein
MKYRKKPVVIEAVQFIESNGKTARFSDYPNWLLDENLMFDEKNNLLIETLEGVMTANQGDYIIKGVQGELYPCKPDIFEQTYDQLERE